MTSRPAATCSPAGLRRSASRSTGPTAPTSSPPTSPPWARRTRWSSAWRCPTGPVWSPSRAPSSTTTTRRPGAPWSGSRSASGRRCSRRRSAGSPSWAAQAAERGGLSRWRPGRPAARMDRMTTTSGGLSVTGRLRRLRASWPAPLPSLVRIAPFALFGYGAYGIWLMHSLLAYETGSAFYGFVHATRAAYPAFRSSRGMWLVLTQALACLVAGVWLLAWTDGPGGGAVRRAAAQLRGTDSQARTVPALLLLPVIFLWQELFGQHLWFGSQGWQGFTLWPPAIAVLIFGAGVIAVLWFPRTAAITAVAGITAFGLCGLVPPPVVTDH